MKKLDIDLSIQWSSSSWVEEVINLFEWVDECVEWFKVEILENINFCVPNDLYDKLNQFFWNLDNFWDFGVDYFLNLLSEIELAITDVLENRLSKYYDWFFDNSMRHSFEKYIIFNSVWLNITLDWMLDLLLEKFPSSDNDIILDEMWINYSNSPWIIFPYWSSTLKKTSNSKSKQSKWKKRTYSDYSEQIESKSRNLFLSFIFMLEWLWLDFWNTKIILDTNIDKFRRYPYCYIYIKDINMTFLISNSFWYASFVFNWFVDIDTFISMSVSDLLKQNKHDFIKIKSNTVNSFLDIVRSIIFSKFPFKKFTHLYEFRQVMTSYDSFVSMSSFELRNLSINWQLFLTFCWSTLVDTKLNPIFSIEDRKKLWAYVFHKFVSNVDSFKENFVNKIIDIFPSAYKFMSMKASDFLNVRICWLSIDYISKYVFWLELHKPSSILSHRAILWELIYWSANIFDYFKSISNDKSEIPLEYVRDYIKVFFPNPEDFMNCSINKLRNIKIFWFKLKFFSNSVMWLWLTNPINIKMDRAVIAKLIYWKWHECIESELMTKDDWIIFFRENFNSTYFSEMNLREFRKLYFKWKWIKHILSIIINESKKSINNKSIELFIENVYWEANSVQDKRVNKDKNLPSRSELILTITSIYKYSDFRNMDLEQFSKLKISWLWIYVISFIILWKTVQSISQSLIIDLSNIIFWKKEVNYYQYWRKEWINEIKNHYTKEQLESMSIKQLQKLKINWFWIRYIWSKLSPDELNLRPSKKLREKLIKIVYW